MSMGLMSFCELRRLLHPYAKVALFCPQYGFFLAIHHALKNRHHITAIIGNLDQVRCQFVV